MAGIREHWERWSLGWPGRLASWALIGIVAACLAEVVALIAMGGTWEIRSLHLHAANPLPRLLLAAGAGFAAYFIRRGGRNSGREWAQIAGRLVLCAFSTAVALLATEIGLRLILKHMQAEQSLDKLGAVSRRLTKEQIVSGHPLAAITQKSADPRLIYELKPNLNMEFGHRTLRTNRLGLREDRDFAVEKGTNVFRIVGLGDSGMFGWDVHQGEEYLAVLESNLNTRADGHLYEVINLGVPGYNTQLEVESLRMKGLQFKPDIVVVGWCDNDFSLPYFIPQDGQWNRRDVSYLYYLLFDRKRYAEVALSQVRDQRSYDMNRVPEYFRRGTDIDGVSQAFADLKALGKQFGFKVLVMGPMQKEAQQICDRLGILCYNTWDRIPENAYPAEYKVHFMHPRAGGHRVLAECIEKEFTALGWLPARP